MTNSELLDRHEFAQRAASSGDHAAAEALEREVLAHDPLFFWSLRGLGAALLAQGRHPEALTQFKTAQAVVPNDLWTLQGLSACHRALGQTAEAEDVMRALLALQPENADFAVSLAKLVADRNADEAIALLEAARSTKPGDPGLLVELGRLYLDTQWLDEAEAILFAALQADPRFCPALRALGNIRLAQGRGAEAIAFYRQAVEYAPADVYNRLGLARGYARAKNLTQAEAIYREILREQPAQSDTLQGLANVYRQRGEFASVLALLRQAQAVNPANSAIRRDILATLLDLGDFEEAERVLAGIFPDDPIWSASLASLAQGYRRQGEIGKALDLLERCATQRELPADLRLERAHAFRDDRQLSRAADHYRALQDNAVVGTQAIIESARCLLRLGKALSAQALLREALETRPDHPDILLALADALRATDRNDEADAMYDRLIALEKSQHWAWGGKGVVARKRGNLAGAEACLQQALALNAHNGDILVELAFLCAERNEGDRARTILDTALEFNPRRHELLHSAARLEVALGTDDKAIAHYESFLERVPHHIDAMLELLSIFRRTGDSNRARTILDRASRANPRHPGVLEALAADAAASEKIQAALALCEQSVAIEPGRLHNQISVARFMVILGRIEEGFVRLDEIQANFGEAIAIEDARVDLLRQLGRFDEALRVSKAARMRFPHSLTLRVQWLLLLIELGGFAEVETSLAEWAPAGRLEVGQKSYVEAALDMARWDFAAARQKLWASLEQCPDQGWLHNRLVHCCMMLLDFDASLSELRKLALYNRVPNVIGGRSTNITQNHYGQIFDDFRLDADAVSAMLPRLAGNEPLAGLCDVVRKFPDSTAVAIQFVLAARRSGRLNSMAPSPGPGGTVLIPRVLIQYWDKDDVPEDIAALSADWRRHNPDFDYRRFSLRTARAYVASTGDVAALRAFDRLWQPAMQADLFRLVFLFHSGGVYADADDRCRSPLEPLLQSGGNIVLYQEDLGSVANNFIAVCPGHQLIGRALANAVAVINRGDSDIVWLCTGPGLLSRALAAWVCDGNDWEQRLASLRILDRHEMLAFTAIHCMTSYKYTGAHWTQSSFKHREP